MRLKIFSTTFLLGFCFAQAAYSEPFDLGEARPHPIPLPLEREPTLAASGKSDAINIAQRRNQFSLSPRERAGMRAGVLTNGIDPAIFEFRDGGIIRGPKDKKRIALEFTSGGFVEGGTTILDQLAKHHAKASFFFTGDYFTNRENKLLARRLIKEGHYLGPHSDTHPLYCPWSGPKTTLVTKEFFVKDLEDNLKKIESIGVKRSR